MLAIREMTVADLECVAEIEKEIFSMPWSRDGFQNSLNQDNTLYLIAECDCRIVGYCGLLQAIDEADITNVAVEEKARGNRIAFKMLGVLMEKGQSRGIRGYTLEVRKSNEAAIRLYYKLGFEEAGIRKNFYEKPSEDAVIMWRHK